MRQVLMVLELLRVQPQDPFTEKAFEDLSMFKDYWDRWDAFCSISVRCRNPSLA